MHTVDRVAGLLVLLYAQPASRITALTLDRVDTTSGGTQLRLGSSPVRLPSPLDRPVTELVARRVGHTGTGRTATNRWLFRGAAPGTPLSSARLTARLRGLGILTWVSRNTALMDLAGHLPAAVLSQLLGLHLETATSWTIEAGNIRQRYAARRTIATRDHT